MSISGIFVYQFRPTILSKLNRTISSSDENSIRRVWYRIFRGILDFKQVWRTIIYIRLK
jgi:hypothetical protein